MAGRMRAAIAASLLIVALAGCASTAQETEMETESVGATPTPTPEPSLEPTTFTTQNGTASFALPVGWSVDDTSALQPRSNHGGPVWQNSVQVLDADGVVRAMYSDGYGDDVGAASDSGVVRSLPMAGGLHAAAWWTTGEGEWWEVAATVVGDPAAPQTSVLPEGSDRLHSFSATLDEVPECASVVDEASAVACLEAPGTSRALELLATLELEPLPWDAMPDDVDPQADVPWLDFVSGDGALSFTYPASWSLLEHDFPGMLPGETFVTLVTPDGYQALDVRRTTVTPHQTASWCDASHGGWEPFELVAAERIDLVTDPALLSGPVELATVAFGASDGTVGVAILPAERVAEGCFEPIVEVGSGAVEVSTPWGTDITGTIYDRFPGGVGFVGSYEHEVMLDVARTVMAGPA